MLNSISSLKPGAHIHMIGICGTAMASLAGLLQDRGFRVTGSDANPYPPMSTQIRDLGITLYPGYSAKNLAEKPDLVIIGNVIPASNEEAQEVTRLKVPFTSLPAALGEAIIADRKSIVISGTHGKTTTTSLMSWVADQAGLQPGFLIGGIPKNFSKSFRNPEGDYFIIEGDEYDTAYFDKVPKFIHYRPRHVIFTSCEFDHADIYSDFEAVKAAFLRLMHLIPVEGSLIYWGEDPHVAALAAECRGPRYSYGLREGHFTARVLSQGAQTRFEVRREGELLGEFAIPLSGDYNILNATAVIAQAALLQWDMTKVKEALEKFEGVKRRQEILGEPGGVLVIEDFAHHPTAVRETLRGLKARYPDRFLWAVFEPRSATSRRKVFQRDYVQAFQGADGICIARAFDQSKIDQAQRFSSEQLVADLIASGKTAGHFDSADAIVAHLKKSAIRGHVIVVMSNGGFDGIYRKLLEALEVKTA